MSDDRPSEDEVLLDIAAQVARRATCSRLQVGAVLARDDRDTYRSAAGVERLRAAGVRVEALA